MQMKFKIFTGAGWGYSMQKYDLFWILKQRKKTLVTIGETNNIIFRVETITEYENICVKKLVHLYITFVRV